MRNLKKIDAAAPDGHGLEAETQLNLPPVLGLADGSQADVPSPARTLQQRLVYDLSAEAETVDDDGQRWAPRATLLFSAGAALTLWAAIAAGIALFH
jgi:hypothetical protein